jgi:hypothetical protein
VTRSTSVPTAVITATPSTSAANTVSRSPPEQRASCCHRAVFGAQQAAAVDPTDAAAAPRQRHVVGHQHQCVPACALFEQQVADVLTGGLSRLPVGSSANRMRGRATKARAIATRCCSPPESWRG